jgi:hypothetical protein
VDLQRRGREGREERQGSGVSSCIEKRQWICREGAGKGEEGRQQLHREAPVGSAEKGPGRERRDVRFQVSAAAARSASGSAEKGRAERRDVSSCIEKRQWICREGAGRGTKRGDVRVKVMACNPA